MAKDFEKNGIPFNEIPLELNLNRKYSPDFKIVIIHLYLSWVGLQQIDGGRQLEAMKRCRKKT